MRGVPSVLTALKRGLAHFLSMSWSSIIWCQRIAQPPISKALPSITYAARGGGATFCIKFHNCGVSCYFLGDFFRESLVKSTDAKSFCQMTDCEKSKIVKLLYDTLSILLFDEFTWNTNKTGPCSKNQFRIQFWVWFFSTIIHFCFILKYDSIRWILSLKKGWCK